MHIVVVGMNHQTASVELRERVSLNEDALERVLTQLRGTRTVMESVVLSTCNRTEMYALVSSVRAGHDFLLTVLAAQADLDKEELLEHTYLRQGEEAVTHAMRVSSGLDSVVVGETQILGQMRDAFQVAFEAGNTGAMFNRLFREVIHVGKRAQAETGVGQHPVSVGYAAVQLAGKVVGDFGHKTALVIGAGHMGTLAAQHFVAQGIHRLLIANRSEDKGRSLAEAMGGEFVAMDDVRDVLSNVDIVVSATSRPGYTVTGDDVLSALKSRKAKPIVFLDLAVPRDLDPRIGDIVQGYLYDVDALSGVIDANVKERERQALLVEHIVAEGVETFSNWLTEQEVVPLIAALRSKGEAIEQSVLASLMRKLPDLSERDKKVIHKHTMSIVNQLLRDPIQNVKELALASGDPAYVTMFAQLFGIDPVVFAQEHAFRKVDEVSTASFVEMFQRLLGDADGDGKRILHPVLR